VQRDGKDALNRDEFVPETIWVHREDGWMVPLHRAEDPERWLNLVNSGEAIATQVDDGTDKYDGKGIFPTSSSSAPWLVEKMLDLLDVHKGMNVLEIGAGTGYNAALLAGKAAPGRVTTIEVDPGVAEHARTALARTGLPVTVITGDGALGHPECAPFDRVIATAGTFTIPYAWVEQTRPNGRIVLPLAGSFQSGTLLSLTVGDDGTARGRFHGEAAFMYLRDQRPAKALWRVWNQEGAQFTTTHAYSYEPFTEFEAGFALGIRLPGWVTRGRRDDDDGILLMSHFASGSWAVVTFSPTGEHKVACDGPRRLWEELEAAYQWWTDAGRPDHTRFGVTVTSEGQTFWLDTPDQVVSPRTDSR
jgi:protein-L-isoaspartate O-methyltransferase